jgi:hypothetical protein
VLAARRTQSPLVDPASGRIEMDASSETAEPEEAPDGASGAVLYEQE